MAKTLKITIGSETHPKIEEYNEFKDSFFNSAYQKAFHLVKEILKSNGKEKMQGDFYQQVSNNIIAFVGDRGTGKTSCMQTVYQQLKKVNPKGKKDFDKEFDFSDHIFSTFPTIDPSYFEEKHNILEIIIANMFQKFKDDTRDLNASERMDGNDTRYLEKKRELVKCFQKTKDALDQINQKDTPKTNDSIEELSGLAAGINMKQCMMNLINKYLEYFKEDVLVLAIDDMDLQVKHAFKMTEQIRKYLIIPKVIIFVGVKLNQLTDIIKQVYYDEYKILLGREQGLLDVNDMAGRYLTKLIPDIHRIYLPELGVNMDSRVIIEYPDKKKKDKEFDRIDKAVLHLFFQKSRFMFYNPPTGRNLMVPNNIRELTNLLSLLCDMDEILSYEGLNNDEETEAKQKNQEIKHRNRERFQKYFKDWCYEYLDASQNKFIQEVFSSHIEEVNKKITDYLYNNYLEKNKVDCDNKFADSNNRVYNVSLADVNFCLDRVDGIMNKPFIRNFVFALRTLCSILLYEALEKDETDENNNKQRINSFKGRIGILKKEETNKALKKANKLLIYSDYERLLGGGLLYIDNLYTKKLSQEPGSKKVTEIHNHEINLSFLQELYELILKSNENNLNIQPIKNSSITYRQAEKVNSILAFNICEFFLLTIYYKSNMSFYRSFRHCYYDNLPHEILYKSYTETRGKDNIAVYNSPSVLFNTVKYYNYYKQYKYFKSQGDQKAGNKFFVFWDKVDSLKENSLFWSLFHYVPKTSSSEEVFFKNEKNEKLDGPKTSSSEEVSFKNEKNEKLEKIFIRNMDMINSLQDYLPIGGKLSSKNDVENWDKLTDFYKKLATFEWYLYPKGEGDNVPISFDIFNIIENKFLVKLSDPNEPDAKKLFMKIFKNDQGCLFPLDGNNSDESQIDSSITEN